MKKDNVAVSRLARTKKRAESISRMMKRAGMSKINITGKRGGPYMVRAGKSTVRQLCTFAGTEAKEQT